MKGNGLDKEYDDDLQDFEGAEEEEDLEDELYTVLDDAAREELDELIGLKVAGLDVWEESLSDSEEDEPVSPQERVFFDCDLLLEDGTALELYAAAAYPNPEAEPVKGMDQITAAVGRLADQNLELMDFDQADEEGGLALAFGRNGTPELVIAASAWLVSEWEEDTSENEDEE